MEVFGMAGLFGLILGFMFGVGCAFAVLYTIYMGGYRKALKDSLSESKPARYKENLEKVQTKLSRESSRI
jgi:sensor domain CHASE-containing protein